MVHFAADIARVQLGYMFALHEDLVERLSAVTASASSVASAAPSATVQAKQARNDAVQRRASPVPSVRSLSRNSSVAEEDDVESQPTLPEPSAPQCVSRNECFSRRQQCACQCEYQEGVSVVGL